MSDEKMDTTSTRTEKSRRPKIASSPDANVCDTTRTKAACFDKPRAIGDATKAFVDQVARAGFELCSIPTFAT